MVCINELEIERTTDGDFILKSIANHIEKKDFWAAQIAGKDEKYGIKRNFLRMDADTAGRKIFILRGGLYEFFYRSIQSNIPIRGFVLVKNGKASFDNSAGELDPQYKQEAEKEEESLPYK